MRPNPGTPRTAALIACLLALAGCASPSSSMLVSPWGAVGLHRFDTATQRTALARREAPLPTLDRPLLSSPAPVLAAVD